jgi:hypothetical protein
VWDEQAGAPVAAVRDDRGPADGGLRTGKFPRLAVVAVARNRPADGDDESGVGVDDDLVVGRVPVVLRLLGNRVIPRRECRRRSARRPYGTADGAEARATVRGG